MSKEDLATLLAYLTQEHLDVIIAMIEEMNAHSQKISESLCRSLMRQVYLAA